MSAVVIVSAVFGCLIGLVLLACCVRLLCRRPVKKNNTGITKGELGMRGGRMVGYRVSKGRKKGKKKKKKSKAQQDAEWQDHYNQYYGEHYTDYASTSEGERYQSGHESGAAEGFYDEHGVYHEVNEVYHQAETGYYDAEGVYHEYTSEGGVYGSGGAYPGQTEEGAAQETQGLIEGEEGNGHTAAAATAGAGDEEESVQSHGSKTSRSALLESFRAILDDGVDLIMHFQSAKPRPVRAWLQEDELFLKPKGIFGKTQQYHIGDIVYLEKGKKTNNLKGDSAIDIPELLCFSLVLAEDSLDFQASNRMEREALYQGFSLILEDLKKSASAV